MFFVAQEVTYFGFNVSASGVWPDGDKTEALKHFTQPMSVREVREFFGFCNYFRSMVPHFHQRAGPLFDLTKKSSAWTKGRLLAAAAAAVFKDLRSALASAPIVAYPDFSQYFM